MSGGGFGGPAHWDRAHAGASLDVGPAPAVAVHPLLAGELTDRAPGIGLELACGEGRPAIALARAGWQMTAVDFSAVAIGRGRRIAAAVGARVDWLVADVTTYEPEPPLDVVLVAYLHLPPDVLHAVLVRAAAALTPGGALLVVGWVRASRSGPAHRYDPAALAAAVPALQIRRAERVGDDAVVHLSRSAAP